MGTSLLTSPPLGAPALDADAQGDLTDPTTAGAMIDEPAKGHSGPDSNVFTNLNNDDGGQVGASLASGGPGTSDGAGSLDGLASAGVRGAGDSGGPALLDGLRAGGTGDDGGQLDGLGDLPGCFDFGCSNVLPLVLLSVTAISLFL